MTSTAAPTPMGPPTCTLALKLEHPARGRRGLAFALILAWAWTVAPNAAWAQAFPSKPIRLIVPYPAGGPLDIAARALAEAARPSLGTIVVDNRSGAGGNIGADAVAKAPADGYSLLVGAVATHAINPALYAKMPYDATKDFAPITLIANVPNVLVLNNDFAAKHNIRTVADFITTLKRMPGQTQFASGGNGSAGHLAGELFKMRTQSFALHIPYRGAGPAQMALLSGEVQFMFDNLASAASRIREGKIKALGVTTLKSANAMQDLTPLASSGVAALAGFDISTWFGVFAPAGTPPTVLDKLHADLTIALKSKTMVDALNPMAAEPAPTSPNDFAQLIARDAAKYREIVKFSGAKVD
jgi:tripartite-type tricarboxylate transporter receptor subunit TctC